MGTTDANGVYYPDVGETGWGDEVNTDLQLLSTAITNVAAHNTEDTDAHDASAISFVPSGTVTGTDVQSAVLEVAAAAESGSNAHINDASAAHEASAVAFTPAGSIAGNDVQTAVAEVATDAAAALSTHDADTTAVHGITNTAVLETTTGAQTKVDTHVNDTTAAHAASAIAFTPGGTVAATDVQAAIAEVAAEAGATGAPTTADYLVATAQGGLSAEIVVGATPNGELGGTWGAITVDASHSGSTHAATQAAAEATAAAANTADIAAHATAGHPAAPGAYSFTGIISPTALSGTADNFDPPGNATASTVRLSTNNTTQRNITGWAGGTDGLVKFVHNVGPGPIGFIDEGAASNAANRFAMAGDMILLPDSSMWLQYDATSSRWRAFPRATAATNPAITFGASNLGGTSPYFVRSDDQLIDPTIAHAALSNPHPGYLKGDAAVSLTGSITPSAISAAQDDYNPTGLSTANTLRLATNNTTQRNITGLTAMADGRFLLIHNIGPGPIAFIDEGGTSTAANRFAMAGDMILLPDSSMFVQYDGTSSRWRVFPRATAATNPAITIGTTSAGGTSPYFVRSDDTIAHEPAHVVHDTIWAAKGDLVVATANDAAGILSAPATRQQSLQATDAAGTLAWSPIGASPGGVKDYDEMFYGTTVTANGPLGKNQVTVAGVGAQYTANLIAGTPNHPGIAALVTGTGTTGACHIQPAGATQVSLGGGRARFGAWVQIPTVSDGTDTFTCKVGFTEGVAVDGAYFLYGSAVNSGKWQANTVSNSVGTTGDTGITMTAATWYFLEIEVNAAGTNADFYIDKVLKNSIATNIPTGAGRETGMTMNIIKSAGTTSRQMYVDAWNYELDFTTPR